MEVREKSIANVDTADFVENLTGSQSKKLGVINCDNADINVSGSSTLVIDKLTCKGTITIHCNSSSFIIIKSLSCDTLDIHHGYASSMRLEDISGCKKCVIDVHYSSRLDITGGVIDAITGSVTYTSYVRNVATVKTKDVTVDAGSTYVTN